MDKFLQGLPLHETAQLIFTRGVDIYPDPRVLAQIFQNFKHSKKISVYVAAGNLGTGKSSHQNALLKHFTNNLLHKSTPFYAKKTTLTLTQGVWVYPYPLKLPSEPDVDILLVDLEGMDGIKDKEVSATNLNLTKIFVFGMIISSVFALHTESKVPQSSLEILKKAFEICKKFKSELSIESPKLFLLMKDTAIDPENEEVKGIRDLIEDQLNDYIDERDQLVVLGRGDPETAFINSASKDCSQLIGTSYLKLVDQICKTISQSPKLDPTSVNLPITLEGFAQLVKTACQLLNEDKFEDSLIIAIDYFKLKRLEEIYNESLIQFVDNSLEKAKTFSLDASIEHFRKQLLTDVNECAELFGNRVSQAIKPSLSVQKWTDSHKAMIRTKKFSTGAIEIFAERKIDAEKSQELKDKHEAELKRQIDLTEIAKKSAENLKNEMHEQNQKLQEKMKKIQEESDEKLRQSAEELLENIRKNEQQGIEMKKKHKKELAEIQRTFQEQLANCQEELVKRKVELVRIEEKIRADGQAHLIEMERLKQMYENQSRIGDTEAEIRCRELEKEMQEKEIAWMKEQYERKLEHQRDLRQVEIAMSEVQAKQNQPPTKGFFDHAADILVEPLKILAFFVVKSIVI